jgi:hypothetical protein
LKASGFAELRHDVRRSELGVQLNYVATDQLGGEWIFDVSGSFTSSRSGLARTDTLWKALGKAAVLHAAGEVRPLVLLTTDLPGKGTAGAKALKAVVGEGQPVRDVLSMFDADDCTKLAAYAVGGDPTR